MAKVINLLNFDRESLRDYFKSLGDKPFRADQVIQWIHQYGYQSFDKMTNLSQALRTYLSEHCVVQPPKVVQEQKSKDGTCKWLFQLEDGAYIETVFIPEDDRGTLCISSQVGCPLNCHFCATARLGFKRNLTVAEIIGQLWVVVRALSEADGRHDRKVTNVVMMGMGEPLLNLENVLPALNLMMDDLAYCLSKYRVTVSTVGIVPGMDRLSEESNVSLAVSLHAPNDELRSQIMPINQKYSVQAVIDACKRFFAKDKKRKVSFEYIMLDGINDRPIHARELVRLLSQLPCKVNLIPFNACPNIPYQSSTPEALEKFRNILMAAGIHTVTRKTRGADIQAACGQLAGAASK